MDDNLKQLIDALDNIEDIIDVLMFKTSKHVLRDMASDAILVEYFFPCLSDFDKRVEIKEDEIEKFKKEFNYRMIGVDKQQATKTVEKMKSIERVIDTLIEMMPQDKIEEIARNHIKKVWFEQNAEGDLRAFKNSLNYSYWTN